MSHPFGDLVSQHLHRKHGLTQSKLAEGILKAPAIVTDMCKGRRLTGPQARERVVAIISWLHQQGALEKLDEANVLLDAAGMSPLNERGADEAVLIQVLYPLDIAQPAPTAPNPAPDAAKRHNLPAQLTSFVGRDAEIAEITAQLRRTRLLTLTGAGGVGKTRLALKVAANVLDTNTFANGVWLVEFASLNDSALVPKAVASALKLSDQSGCSQLDALADHFESKQTLLILDNCEHVINACAELADHLLRRCPKLRILATSRETLRMSGEVTYRVPSLTVPDLTHLPPEYARGFEALQLFVERAQASQPKFKLTYANVSAAIRLCRQLDGIPLAVELAAALMQTMTVEEIAAQLDKRLTLLWSGRRATESRHQTMRHALDWSYDLLSPAEQCLLARLSVFAGGWTADEADKVCASEVLPLLNQLVQKSLVVTEQRGDHTRYRLLEPIRQYAAEKLDEMGESEKLRRRHALAYIALAEAAQPHLHSHGQKLWFDRLGREHDNFRSALAWSQSAAGDADLGLRLAGSLWYFWHIRGHLREGRTWLDGLLAVAGPDTPPEVRAWALFGAGWLAIYDEQGYANHKAAPLLEEAIALFRNVGDDAGLALSLCEWAIANFEKDHAQATSLIEESLRISRRQNAQSWITPYALNRLADIAFRQADIAGAVALWEEVLASVRQMGEAPGVVASLIKLADATGAQLDFARAVEFAEEAVHVSREVGDTMSEAYALGTLADELRLMREFDRATALIEEMHRISLEHDLRELVGSALTSSGLLARDQGNYPHAAASFRQSIHWYRDKLETWGDWLDVLGLGTVACAQGQFQRAARLFGALEAEQRSFNLLRFPHNQLQFGTYIDATRAQLGDAAYDVAFAEGCAMTTEGAFEYALTD